MLVKLLIKTPEAKDYDFSVGDTFFVGDVEFRTRYCYCPNCLLNVSFQKMKKINRKVMLSYLQASLWGREMLKILVQSQALKKVPKNSGQMPWKFSGDAWLVLSRIVDNTSYRGFMLKNCGRLQKTSQEY